MITYIDVFSSLVEKYYPDNNTGWTYRGDIDDIKNLDGFILKGESELKFNFSDVELEKKRLQADYDAKKYQRDRQYPTIGDQLDEIYHQGIDEWKKTIKAVKSKHPKPE